MHIARYRAHSRRGLPASPSQNAPNFHQAPKERSQSQRTLGRGAPRSSLEDRGGWNPTNLPAKGRLPVVNGVLCRVIGEPIPVGVGTSCTFSSQRISDGCPRLSKKLSETPTGTGLPANPDQDGLQARPAHLQSRRAGTPRESLRRSRARAVLVAVFLVGLGLRLDYAIRAPQHPVDDARAYSRIARALYEGDGYTGPRLRIPAVRLQLPAGPAAAPRRDLRGPRRRRRRGGADRPRPAQLACGPLRLPDRPPARRAERRPDRRGAGRRSTRRCSSTAGC